MANRIDYVPRTIDVIAFPQGLDLVARVGQFGINGYGVIRVSIEGPKAEFALYAGIISSGFVVSRVHSPGITDAQFTPPQDIMPGNDLIGVWADSSGYTGSTRMTVITNGGYF